MTDRIVDGKVKGLTIERFCAALEWRLYLIRKSVAESRERRFLRRVAAVLADPSAPVCLDSDELFESLQQEYPPHSDYGSDAFSSWQRGVERAATLLSLPSLDVSGGTIVEIGAGDGMVGRVLSDYGQDVTLVDGDDWRDTRAAHMRFAKCDVCESVPLKDDSADLVFSYNTFEHLSDPVTAFAEFARVCKPGGLIFLSFNPLYWAPWGLHAFSQLRMPYPQMLFSREFIDAKIRDLGIEDLGRTMYALQPVNRWRPSQYLDLWGRVGFRVLSQELHENRAHLAMVERFPEAFRGRGIDISDLTIEGIAVLLRKTEHSL